MRKNVENTFTFIFPYLFNVFFSYPKRYLLVSKISTGEANFRSATSVFPLPLLKKGEVLIIPVYSSTILCFLRRSSIQIPDQKGLETWSTNTEMLDSLSPSKVN